MSAEAHPKIVQLLEHRWQTDGWPIARLTVRLEQIAARNGLRIQSWVEDGLGTATGCGGRLHSGVVIQLVEYAHQVSHQGVRGPDLYADALDVDCLGVDNLLAEALPALGLDWSDVEWRGKAPTAELIAGFKRHVEEGRRRDAWSTGTEPGN